MGTTFENIHIFTRTDDLPEQIRQENRVARLAEDWITLFPKEGFIFGFDSKIPRQLSKMLSYPVLWVSYFDDDIVTLAVFQKGKKVSGYSVDDTGVTLFEKPKGWKEALELTEQEVSALRYLSQSEKTAGETLDLLSPMLGVPLYTAGILDEEENDVTLYRKQTQWVKEWLEEKTALKRIKNHTQMKLCCELLGIHTSEIDELEDWKHGIIRVCPPDGKGSFEYNHICCYRIKEETFVPIYEYRYPEELFGKEDKSLWLDYSNKDIHITDVNRIGNGDGAKYWDAYIGVLENLISDNGRLNSYPPVEELEIPNAIETPAGKYRFVEKRDNHYPILVKELLDGSEHKEYQYESENKGNSEWFWSCRAANIQIIEQQIIMVTQKICYGKTEKVINDIRFFDIDLNLLRKVEVVTYKQEEHMDDFFIYSPERDTIYYKGCACELTSKKIFHSIPKVEGTFLNSFDQKGNIILISGRTTVILFDQELHVLSRHRLKGKIYHIYKNEAGNTCFLTVDEDAYEWTVPKATAALRIYKLSYKEKVSAES